MKKHNYTFKELLMDVNYFKETGEKPVTMEELKKVLKQNTSNHEQLWFDIFEERKKSKE